MKRSKGIDIIIPVYNALDDLKLCLESVKMHTDLSLDRLLLIDDKSPDAAVYPYLKSVEQGGIVVLQNEENQGFSGTINRGIQYSDRDVLLLNADTIVTQRWVDKLVSCAYSDEAIGTVTPFSNNATLCSIPNFCEENEIPYGLSIDEYAQVIESCSMRKYPRITVAVGFCMFIKREVIGKVGLFDQKAFQRGYGEENDFCWRAEQLGYFHVLCDDTYIYHSGTASFLSEEKKKLIAEHEGILEKRYPKQLQGNAEYVRDNPHQYLRSNVDIYARLRNGKRNVLYLLHMDFRADANNNIGGTQFHVKDLAMNLRRDCNVFVLARDGEVLRLTAYLEQEQISFKFRIGKKQAFQPFHSKEIEQVLRNVLTAFSIDIVHVHHISDLSFDVFDIAKELGISLLMTLHDYYYICPTIKLLEGETRYCGGCSENCTACLHNQLGYAEQVNYLSVWREKCRKALNLCDKLIVPSEAAKKVYVDVYPEIEERIAVVPHGMDHFDENEAGASKPSNGFVYRIEHALEGDYLICGWAYQKDQDASCSELTVCVEDDDGNCGEYYAQTSNRPDLPDTKKNDKYLCCGFSVCIPDAYFNSGTLKMQLKIRNGENLFYSDIFTVKGYKKREKNCKRIAFLGGLNEAKGSQIAYQLIQQSGKKYDWYIVGGVGDPNLATMEKSNVRKTGWYKRENVGAILQQNQIDLVCILPIWPETFCYTVSEALLAGVPVLGTNIGAVGDRIRQEHIGWLVPHDAPIKDILSKLDAIFADETGFQAVRKTVHEFQHRTIVEMCESYRELYRTYPVCEQRDSEFDAQAIYTGYAMCQAEAGSFADGTDVELIRRINELEATLTVIDQSLEYKMAKFFNRRNFPGKKLMKRMMGFAYQVYKKFFR